mmetsp:Transcript_36440/g.115961  ORF Transcript_36440/g.115961 Transcript_36440/m.115961 type:complete len:233 (-) Transcript_36440:28-726(-)
MARGRGHPARRRGGVARGRGRVARRPGGVDRGGRGGRGLVVGFGRHQLATGVAGMRLALARRAGAVAGAAQRLAVPAHVDAHAHGAGRLDDAFRRVARGHVIRGAQQPHPLCLERTQRAGARRRRSGCLHGRPAAFPAGALRGWADPLHRWPPVLCARLRPRAGRVPGLCGRRSLRAGALPSCQPCSRVGGGPLGRRLSARPRGCRPVPSALDQRRPAQRKAQRDGATASLE